MNFNMVFSSCWPSKASQVLFYSTVWLIVSLSLSLYLLITKHEEWPSWHLVWKSKLRECKGLQQLFSSKHWPQQLTCSTVRELTKLQSFIAKFIFVFSIENREEEIYFIFFVKVLHLPVLLVLVSLKIECKRLNS